MKKILILVGLILLTTGCFAEIEPLNENNEIQKVFAMNEVVNVNNIYYSVIKVEYSEKTSSLNGKGLIKPSEGNEYVLVTIKIENKSEEKIKYFASDWKMQNSLGQEEKAKYTKNFDSAELLQNGVKEGIIIFEQPKKDEDLRLNFYNNSLFDSEYTFQVTIK